MDSLIRQENVSKKIIVIDNNEPSQDNDDSDKSDGAKESEGPDTEDVKVDEISSSEILEMVKDETITEGMIPKINACLDAVNNGVTAAGIINGTKLTA